MGGNPLGRWDQCERNSTQVEVPSLKHSHQSRNICWLGTRKPSAERRITSKYCLPLSKHILRWSPVWLLFLYFSFVFGECSIIIARSHSKQTDFCLNPFPCKCPNCWFCPGPCWFSLFFQFGNIGAGCIETRQTFLQSSGLLSSYFDRFAHFADNCHQAWCHQGTSVITIRDVINCLGPFDYWDTDTSASICRQHWPHHNRHQSSMLQGSNQVGGCFFPIINAPTL